MTYVPPGWITTFSGRKFWPLAPRAEDVAIEDIAHALSMKCRFTGHTRHLYSVAQHSVLVAQVLHEFYKASPWQILAGLLHDATEAYLPDVARPIKADLPGFLDIENRVDTAIFLHFLPGAPTADAEWRRAWHHEHVKEVDTRLLRTEIRDLMPPGSEGVLADLAPYPFTIQCLAPEDARTLFLQKYVQIVEQLDQPRLVQFEWPRAYAGRLDLAPHDHAWLLETLQEIKPAMRMLTAMPGVGLPPHSTESLDHIIDALLRSRFNY